MTTTLFLKEKKDGFRRSRPSLRNDVPGMGVTLGTDFLATKMTFVYTRSVQKVHGLLLKCHFPLSESNETW